MTAFTGMAGRVAIALLLVLLAAGSALAAAVTLPGPAAGRPAEETAAPTPADPSVTPEATRAPKPTKAPEPARAPEADDDDDGDGTPSTANLERVVARLGESGITTTTADLGALAAKVGVGGAVRVLLFADAAGKTPAEIVAAFETGTGWGVIAKELGLHPGIGSIMGNGHGLDKAAGKAERAAARAAAKAQRAQERADRSTAP